MAKFPLINHPLRDLAYATRMKWPLTLRAICPLCDASSMNSASNNLPARTFENLRGRLGIFCAPVAFLVLWLLPCPELSETAHRLLAILGAVVVLWVTEAIPLPVTALLGPALCVVLGVGQARDIFRSFADPIIFLFLGSFLLAEG